MLPYTRFGGMLIKDPSLLRVRLELGRALFSRGACLQPPPNLLTHILGDDCWAAEQHFVRSIGKGVPPSVALNVRRFIRVIRARKQAQGSLNLALAPDTNVNMSTSADTVNNSRAALPTRRQRPRAKWNRRGGDVEPAIPTTDTHLEVPAGKCRAPESGRHSIPKGLLRRSVRRLQLRAVCGAAVHRQFRGDERAGSSGPTPGERSTLQPAVRHDGRGLTHDHPEDLG